MRSWLPVAVVLLAAGCSTTASRRAEFESALAARVSSAACPMSQVRVEPIGTQTVEGTDIPVRQHVDACGSRGDFEFRAYRYEEVTPPSTAPYKGDPCLFAPCGQCEATR
jgi:hypothetical protein